MYKNNFFKILFQQFLLLLLYYYRVCSHLRFENLTGGGVKCAGHLNKNKLRMLCIFNRLLVFVQPGPRVGGGMVASWCGGKR